MYILKCKDWYGDGWHGGSITVEGTRYCEDFKSGYTRSIKVPIGRPGKVVLASAQYVDLISYKIILI